nr:hypothetical protein [Tanacetum cinerariifolium]
MTLKPNLSSLEEFVNEPIVSEPTVKKPIVETSEAKTIADKPKVIRKDFGSSLIKDWISDSEDEAESKPKIEKETVKPSFAKIKFVKSKEQVKCPMKTTVKQEHVADEAVNEEMDDSLVRAATTATSLDAEQDKGNIFKTQSKATPNELGSKETSLGGGRRCQKTMGDTIAQTRSERVSKISNNLILAGVNIPQSVWKLQRVLDLGEEDVSKQGRIADIDANEDIYLVNIHNDEDMFSVNDLDGDEVIVESIDVAEMNTFVDYKAEVVLESLKKAEVEVTEGSSKRAREELKQENAKKQKMEDDKESTDLKQCLEIITDDGHDVTIDAIPLSSKSPTIVDYKIYKEGRKSYFQIFKVDGNSQLYLTFSKMLKNFDREDLEVL